MEIFQPTLHFLYSSILIYLTKGKFYLTKNCVGVVFVVLYTKKRFSKNYNSN